MRWLVGFLTLTLLAAAAIADTPTPTMKQGRKYRFMWHGNPATATKVRFPLKSTQSNVVPTDTTLIKSTNNSNGSQAVEHVQMILLSQDIEVPFVVWGPQFPAGIDTVYCNPRVPIHTVSGVPVDSVLVDYTGGLAPLIMVIGSDGDYGRRR